MLKYPCTQFFPWKFTTTSNLNTFYIPSMHSYDIWIYMYLNFLHALHLELFKFLRAIVMTWPKFRHLDSWTVLIKTEFWWKWFVKALSLTKIHKFNINGQFYEFHPLTYFYFLSEKFVMYPKLSSLSEAIPKLVFIPHAESIAVQFLQMIPSRRISAHQALHHEYFGDLPPKLFELPDGMQVYFVLYLLYILSKVDNSEVSCQVSLEYTHLCHF